MDKEILEEIKIYIENQEVSNAGEWGRGETLEELIKTEQMPDLYKKILDLLK